VDLLARARKPMTDSSGKVKILIVDDEQMIRQLMEATLADEGYEVHCASDGEDGAAMARSLLPDLVLTDVVMPAVDGFEMCRQLRRDPATASIPIIFVTVCWEEEDYRAGFNLGVDDYLAKPFRRVELITRVRAALQRAGIKAPEPSAARKPAVPGPGPDLPKRNVLLAGRLAAASIPEVLQTVGLNVISGTLLVHSKDEGRLELRRGELVRAEVTTPRRMLYGFKAWLRVASWTQGDFEVLDSGGGEAGPEPVRNIELPMQALLLEAALHRDEALRLRALFPSEGIRLQRQGSLPPDASSVERQIWTAASGEVDLDALLDELDVADRDILQAVLKLMHEQLLESKTGTRQS
jgi:DNA-binding response OmpR family regulator